MKRMVRNAGSLEALFKKYPPEGSILLTIVKEKDVLSEENLQRIVFETMMKNNSPIENCYNTISYCSAAEDLCCYQYKGKSLTHFGYCAALWCVKDLPDAFSSFMLELKDYDTGVKEIYVFTIL